MENAFMTQTLYFEKGGPECTDSLLEHASRRARELGIRKVLMASNTGRTARAAMKYFDPKAFELIVITQVAGFIEPNESKMSDEVWAELEGLGFKVVRAAHAFGGIGRGVRNKLKTFQVDEIMAFTLRMISQGVKVGIEISYMAADRGFVRADEDVMTIAGSGGGADTAMVVRPANSHRALDLRVKEIVAKPWSPV